MFNSKFDYYKRLCQPDKSLSFLLAVEAILATHNNLDKHPKEFAVLAWVVSYN